LHVVFSLWWHGFRQRELHVNHPHPSYQSPFFPLQKACEKKNVNRVCFPKLTDTLRSPYIFPEGCCYFKSRFVMVSFSIFHNKSSPPTAFPSLPFHLNWWKDWGTSRSWSPFSRTTATVAHFIECVGDTAFTLIDHEMKHGLHKKSRLNYTYEVCKEEFLPAIYSCSWTMRTYGSYTCYHNTYNQSINSLGNHHC